MKRFFLLLLVLVTFRTAFAAADDVTLIHSPEAIFSLEQQQQAKLITSRKEEVILEVNDAVVEADRILIRFLISGLPVSCTKFITEENRLYGEYLPIAEIGTPGGSWISPSSESRFSMAANSEALLIAGLLVFPTEEQPKIISFNFNQLPFDTQPLSEGSVMQLSFTEEVSFQRNNPDGLSEIRSDLEFSIRNTAQTESLNMVQPAVRMVRPDETLSQFGWITVHGKESGSQYSVTRGPLYGFNLADDTRYSPGHAYTFSSSEKDTSFSISMDYAYVRRSVDEEITLRIGSSESVPLDWEDHKVNISGTLLYYGTSEGHEIPTLRIYIDGDPDISTVGFSQKGSLYENESPICGFEEQSGRFACEITPEDPAAKEIRLKIDSFEYRKEGPWETIWTAIPLANPDAGQSVPEIIAVDYDYANYSVPDASLRPVADRLSELSAGLSSKPGWIRLAVLVRDASSASDGSDLSESLIPHQQTDILRSVYISETWYRIEENGLTNENIVLLRDPESGRILTGTQTAAGVQLVLPQALRFPGNSASYYAFPFTYDADFLSVLESGTRFEGEEPCVYDGKDFACLKFTQSLLPTADSPKQKIIFYYDAASGTFPRTEVICDDQALCLSKDLIELKTYENLPEELRELTENIVL